MSKLKPGDLAPDFNLPSSLGRDLRLSDYRGKWVVLYFFPKAFTAGCTLETKQFRNAYEELRAMGAEVIGVSADDLPTQCEFAGDLNVSFPLVADVHQQALREYGVLRSLLPVPKRITYIIDPQGIIRAVFQHDIQVGKHLDEVLAFLRANAALP